MQDDGEAGIGNVTVKLVNADGNIVATTSTDAHGQYWFTDLTPGAYSVIFVAPEGMAFTQKDVGDDASDSDAYASGITDQVVLAERTDNASVDAGLVETVRTDASFDFSGSSSVSGDYGNVRSYTSNGIAVDVSAFSRVDSSGDWSSSYLGAFSSGLGVTNRHESGSGNSHTVDNVGGVDDYVVFQFDQDVIVDSTFLGYVVNDSDLRVWVGSSATAIAATGLSDAVLAGMDFTEVDWTGSGSPRLADINAGEAKGNVLIIAAAPDDTTPEDYFKIEHLNVSAEQAICDTGDCGGSHIVVEAEDMTLKDYRVESNSDASGGAVVKLTDKDGEIKTKFSGDDGTYDLKINYIDENDGYGKLKVKVDGDEVMVINLDQQVGNHVNGFTSVTIEDLQIKHDDEVKIYGYKDSGEYARIDSIEFLGDCVDLSNVEMLAHEHGSATSIADLSGLQDDTLDFAYTGSETGATNIDVDMPDIMLIGSQDDQTV